MSAKKPPPKRPAGRQPGGTPGGKQSGKTPPGRPAAAKAANRPQLPIVWIAVGAVVAIAVVAAIIASSGNDGSSAGKASPASAELVANTKRANVPLLDQEGVATHTHTELVVKVNGKEAVVPAGIGIDEGSGRIAALHTHDTSGTIHLESAKENDHYTLEQFLTVWGLPADAAGRCRFFQAAAPCTLSVASKDSGPVGLDVTLVDHDVLTLTVTSS